MSFLFCFLFLLFSTGGLFHKGGIQIIRTLRKGWKGVYIAVVKDFQNERTKVQESVYAPNFFWKSPKDDLQVLKFKSPYFAKKKKQHY